MSTMSSEKKANIVIWSLIGLVIIISIICGVILYAPVSAQDEDDNAIANANEHSVTDSDGNIVSPATTDENGNVITPDISDTNDTTDTVSDDSDDISNPDITINPTTTSGIEANPATTTTPAITTRPSTTTTPKVIEQTFQTFEEITPEQIEWENNVNNNTDADNSDDTDGEPPSSVRVNPNPVVTTVPGTPAPRADTTTIIDGQRYIWDDWMGWIRTGAIVTGGMQVWENELSGEIIGW